MAFAALAILGHKSAHSFPMGPVMADPELDKRQYQTLFITKSTKCPIGMCYKNGEMSEL